MKIVFGVWDEESTKIVFNCYKKNMKEYEDPSQVFGAFDNPATILEKKFQYLVDKSLEVSYWTKIKENEEEYILSSFKEIAAPQDEEEI